jgi:shikimate dehydrogenase
MTTTSFVVGLLGDNIGGSLAKPLQEGEGEAQGLSLAYRLVDGTHTGLGLDDTADVLRWATRLGFDGLAVTHPFKNAVMSCVDEATPEAQALGASNLVVIRDGRSVAHNTDWVGFAEALRATLPEALGDRMVLLGAGGAGVAVGYAALRYGAAQLKIVDQDVERAAAVAARLGALVGRDRVSSTTDLAAALRGAGGLIQATPVGMDAHPGLPFDPALLRPDQWVADIIYFPLETELVHRARAAGCRVMTGGAMAVHQHAAAFALLTGRPADIRRMQATFEALTGQQVALSHGTG